MIGQEVTTTQWLEALFKSQWAAELTVLKQHLPDPETQPQNVCGDCTAYKTPFCSFPRFAGIIKKTDIACADFYPDRHIPRSKPQKRTVVMQRLGKR
jgi:hypothetical protein